MGELGYIASSSTDADLVPEITTTNWCAAHQLSLAARFSFGEKEQSEIWPPDRKARLLMADFLERLKTLVEFSSDARTFRALEQYAAAHNQQAPHVMNAICPTRFNSLGFLLRAVAHNQSIFLIMHGLPRHSIPTPVAALILEQEVSVDGKMIRYTPIRELDGLLPIVDEVMALTSYAENNDGDACLFQMHLSKFVRQLNGEAAWKDGAKLGSGLLVPGVVDNFKNAIGFYFDKNLHFNWAMLISLALHPACAPSVSPDGTWACFAGRFKDVWTKRGSSGTSEDPDDVMIKIMQAANLLLRQELELQYEIDNGTEEAPSLVDPIPVAAPDDLLPTLSLAPTPTRPTSWAAARAAAVSAAMSSWKTRQAPDMTFLKQPMIEYWRTQPDSLLKRTAIRAAASLVSQCATERANKIPKQVWTNDRMSVGQTSMKRDVFIHVNRQLDGLEDDVWEDL